MPPLKKTKGIFRTLNEFLTWSDVQLFRAYDEWNITAWAFGKFNFTYSSISLLSGRINLEKQRNLF